MSSSNISECIVSAISEMQNVCGNKLNPHFKSKYVTLDLLLDSIKPILNKHNLALLQVLVSERLPGDNFMTIGVSTQFIHKSGEIKDMGKLCINSTNLDPQKIGSALTYLRRQSIQSACCISIDLDDDGNSISSSTTSSTFNKQTFIKK